MKLHSVIVRTGLGIFFASAVIVFIYALFCRELPGEAYTGSFDSYTYNEGWILQTGETGEEHITLPARIRADKEERITIHNILPESIRTGMSLAIRTAMEDVEIWIDGKLRGSYGRDGYHSYMGYPPSEFVFVDLDSTDASKEIEICFIPYDGGYVSLNAVEYSYGDNIWFGLLKRNLAMTFFAVALILMGIIAVVILAFMRKKVEIGSAFLYLSLFIIVISLWILSESKIRQLFFSAPYYTTVVAYLFVELMAAYAVMFVDELQGHYYRRIFSALETVILVQVTLNTILNFTGLCYYHDTLIYSHVWSAAAILAVLVTLVLDFRSGRVRKYLFAAYGLAGTIVCSVTEILLFYLTDKGMLGLFIGLGLLILVGTTLAQTVTDILALKQQKDQNEMEARVANASNRAKSEFLAQMSHEIRTPINAVLGMNEMILRESGEDNVREYASNAYNAGQALLSIINDILDISKIEAGKLEIVTIDYDLYSLVSDCYNMTSDRAKKKGLEFTYSVDEKLPTKLHGDMFHIRQIVVNFLTNAIKYTDEGSVELAFFGEKTDWGLLLKFSVKDTGIGLTEESKEKLFESFQRFDLKRNQTVEGTGLGLSICRQLAELMGGGVSAESVYGQGSTFSCGIPQGIADDTPVGKMVINHQAKVSDDRMGKLFTAESAHILVVDDVEMNLVVFKGLLKENKLKIDTALSGRQCLELLQGQKYDMIFMDHMMPEMDGVETYQRMKEMEHLNQDTPVIMLTANAISGEKEKYMAEGFSSYLTKPIQSDKLRETLLKYLPPEKIAWEERDVQKSVDSSGGAAEKLQGSDKELINKKLGLSYSGGSGETYSTILGSYVKNGKENLEKLNAHFSEEAWNDYVILAHALKSTSLTIGAEELSEAAKELELAGKAGNYGLIKEKNGKLLELYRKVLRAAEEILGMHRDDAAEQAPKDTACVQQKELAAEELLVIRRRLKKAADAFDGDEMLAVCVELSECTYHGWDLAERFAKVKELVEDFEIMEAGVLAEQLFEEFLS